MAAVTRAGATAARSDLDEFLFAPVDENKANMPLTVLSTLARAGLDPWQEAAELAKLPREVAAQRLESLILALPAERSAGLDPRAIAGRLIALLPRRAVAAAGAARIPLGAVSGTNMRAALLFAILMAFMLFAQSVIESHRQAAPAEHGHAGTAGPDTGAPVIRK